jgi:hypothetical protein
MMIRKIDIPEFDTQEPEEFVHVQSLSESDKSFVAKLAEDLMSAGVLDRESDVELREQSPEEFEALLEYFSALGMSEKELNPDFYDSELDKALDVLEQNIEEFENPDLPGSDFMDYQEKTELLIREGNK